ncbi:MAG: hypothetical protein REH79_01725 [Spiroplasma sp.]|nr:hypothetical protein [Spiroplasma sp.]
MSLNIIEVLLSTLLISCPLILLATGGILNTKVGIANFGFDGIMCVGASLYCLIISQLRASMGSAVIVFAFFLTIIMGLLFSLLYSFATITCKADQMLTSMAINFLGYGLAVALPITFTGSLNFSLSSISIKLYPVVAIVLTLVLLYLFAIILFLTRFGLYVRVIGENRNFAVRNYLKIGKAQYLISCFSSSLACFGGGLLVYINPNFFIVNNNFSGLGFLVIVLWMIGRNRFVFTSIICLLFAFIFQMSIELDAISSITEILPNWFIGMIPYLATLVFLMVFRYDPALPPMWAQPYIKDKIK